MDKPGIWIGICNSNGGVRAEFVSPGYEADNGETATHAGLGMHHGRRWRFRVGTNTVFWWTAPEIEETEAVDNFLKRHGIPKMRHKEMLDASVEDDIAHGRRLRRVSPEGDVSYGVPLQYRYRTEAKVSDIQDPDRKRRAKRAMDHNRRVYWEPSADVVRFFDGVPPAPQLDDMQRKGFLELEEGIDKGFSLCFNGGMGSIGQKIRVVGPTGKLQEATRFIYRRGVGKCPAMLARQLKVGDITTWHHEPESYRVASITELSPHYLEVVEQGVHDPDRKFTSRYKKDKLIAAYRPKQVTPEDLLNENPAT